MLTSVADAIKTLELAEPELNLAEVAREHAMLVRYVQKSLGGAGRGFSTYVRDRRLDRAKSDLSSPLFHKRERAGSPL